MKLSLIQKKLYICKNSMKKNLIQTQKVDKEKMMMKKVNQEDKEYNVLSNDYVLIIICLINYILMKQARITRLHPILSPPKNEEVLLNYKI